MNELKTYTKAVIFSLSVIGWITVILFPKAFPSYELIYCTFFFSFLTLGIIGLTIIGKLTVKKSDGVKESVESIASVIKAQGKSIKAIADVIDPTQNRKDEFDPLMIHIIRFTSLSYHNYNNLFKEYAPDNEWTEEEKERFVENTCARYRSMYGYRKNLERILKSTQGRYE